MNLQSVSCLTPVGLTLVGLVRRVPESFPEKSVNQSAKSGFIKSEFTQPDFVRLYSMVNMAANTREGRFIRKIPGFKRLVESSILLQKRQAYKQLKRLSKRYLGCPDQDKTAFRKQLIKEYDQYLQSEHSSKRCSKVLKARYQLMLESSDQRNALMKKKHYGAQKIIPYYVVEQSLPALLHTVEINPLNSIQPQRARYIE